MVGPLYFLSFLNLSARIFFKNIDSEAYKRPISSYHNVIGPDDTV